VLDICCADGLSTFQIARPDLEVMGFDVSRESVALATEHARARGLENVSFFVADADAIPIQPERLDCVLCYGSLHHVPDPARTLAEADRVLKPSGLYLGVENHKTPLRPVFDLLMRLRPLWREEAGAEAQIGTEDLDRWTAGSRLRVTTKTNVFVPPHLCNWIGYKATLALLRWTNAVLSRIPGVRRCGGLIEILGRKEPSAAPAHDVLGAQGQPSESALQP
jgi:2-polyprenyl-3-methyl-5-hydroxy-6-metoxy-1,4-benzoquinol methylase